MPVLPEVPQLLLWVAIMDWVCGIRYQELWSMDYGFWDYGVGFREYGIMDYGVGSRDYGVGGRE